MKKFLLLVLILIYFFNFKVNAQISAAFSATPLNGCSPVLVQFTNQSIGNPTSYFWDLGNGITSNLPNPSTTYFNAGQYTIKLVITKGALKDSIVKINYVKVDATPIVNFTALDSVGCVPFTAQFTNFASVPNGSIGSYLWDFGDGTTSALPNPSHIYSVPGFYTVSLTIISNSNCVKSFSKTAFINAKDKPIASFTSLIQPACTAPITVGFTNTSTGVPILSCSWNFGDAASGVLNTTTTTNPSHIYNSGGSYNITMLTSSTNGCRDSSNFILNVGSGSLNAAFSLPASSCEDDALTIVNTTTPTPSSVLWNFGDGTTSTQFTPIKTYTTPGMYTIILNATLGSCTSSDTQVITINPKPVSLFVGVPFVSCAVPSLVSFTNQSGFGLTYLWNFGDGGTSSSFLPSHTYNAEGIYTVSLTTTNNFGCSHTFTVPNFITVAKPVINLTNLPQRGCVPYNYTPTYNIVSNDPIVSYNWTFGDGATGTGANPNHIYTTQGTYTIKVVYTTSTGCVDSTIFPAAIIVGTKPNVFFSAMPRDTCAQFLFNFFDNTPPTVDQWLWSFGDGGTSILQNPVYQYSDTGFFDVQLIALNNGCGDTLQIPNFIYVRPPIAIFQFIRSCDTPFLIRFIDFSIGAVTYSWDFGDGTTSILQNPVHIYALPGNYTVTLVVSNGACTYSRVQLVRIVNELPDFNATLIELCKGNSTQFTATNINVNNIANYYWQFGDGTTSNASAPSHIYSSSGIYTITLITTSILGCFDTVVKPNYITVFGPTANFNVLNNRSCTNQGAINFANISTTDGTHAIVNNLWNFGDGTTLVSAATPLSHVYTSNGVYTVKLLVTDSYGCSDSLTLPNALVSGSVTAAFISPDTASCPTKNIRFTNQSAANITQNLWSFGDGQTSSLPNPTHVYAADGNYTIKLVVSDAFGCIDSITKPAYINIISPKAIFAVSDSFKTCPPLIVNYTNNSINALQNQWDFGDASFSTLLNPTHVFNVPGAFVSKLVVTSQGGCKDSAFKTIRINGPSGTFTYAPLTGCAPLTVNFTSTAINTLNYIYDYADGNTFSSTGNANTYIYNNVGQYLPKLILEDALGCRTTAVGLDTISTYGVSGIIKANKYLICGPGDGLIQFSDSITSNDTYNFISWNFGDGVTINSAVPPTHLYTTPGIYYPTALVSTSRGCIVTLRSTVPIRFVNKPNIILSTDTSKCVPASFGITALSVNSDTNVINYNWTLPASVTSTNVVPPIFNTSIAGSFPLQLIIQDGFGCKDTANAILEARPLPIINAGLDSFVCRGNTINLLATGAASYTWSPNYNLSCLNCNNPTAGPLLDTSYVVTGFTLFGCTAKDTVAIKVQQPFTLSSDPGGTICPGFSFQLNARGADKYLWSPNDGSLNNINIANPLAKPLTTTTYIVTGSDNKNCFSFTNNITVTVAAVPTINAGPDRTVAIGEVVNINPVSSADVVSWSWYPSLYLACTNCPATTSTPFSNILYQIEVENATGCKFRDSININVFCEANNIFLPNTFSPNADGSNDVFYVRARGQLVVKSFRIYNRWGQQVFGKQELVPNNPAMGWDGTFNGKKLEPDVFVYHLDVICNGEFKGTIKGNVTLLK